MITTKLCKRKSALNVLRTRIFHTSDKDQCRWLAYRGASIPLCDLLCKPENSLIAQSQAGSYTPFAERSALYTGPLHKLRNHEVNADGFGVAWYSNLKPTSTIFKSIYPAWSDRNLTELAEVISSPTIFAHIRAASPGSAVTLLNCHPFKYGRLTFMHNGGIAGFNNIKRSMREKLRDDFYNTIEGR